MLLLPNTTSVLRVITSAAVTVDCYASWVDYGASAVGSPGGVGTNITTAATTTIVPAVSSGSRNVTGVTVRNTSSSGTVTVTIQVYDSSGPYTFEQHEATLGPGQSCFWSEGRWFTESSSSSSQPWETQIIGAIGNGDPGIAMMHMQRAGNIAATPTNIGTSVARCSLFSPRKDITINRIRCYGVGATTNVYRVAVYRYSDLARLTSELAFTTAASTWANIGSALALSLTAGTIYFVACAVNATGTTAGIGCIGGTVAATTGQIATAPDSLPGSLAASGGYLSQYMFQFAVTSGALPATAATLAAQAAWTGGMPCFFLDAADV